MKRDEYLIGIHHLPAILEAATKHGSNHVTNEPEPAHSPGNILSRVSMGWWPLRLSAKILALLRLSVNFFQLRLTKKLKINFFCFKKLNIN